jgi:hypothetical protein
VAVWQWQWLGVAVAVWLGGSVAVWLCCVFAIFAGIFSKYSLHSIMSFNFKQIIPVFSY